MKPSEILLASAVLSIVAGAGAALAAGTFFGLRYQRSQATDSLRAAQVDAERTAQAAVEGRPDVARELDELRMENVSLRDRLQALERALGEGAGTRAPLAEASEPALLAADSPELMRMLAGDVTPEFVARVGEAMATIEAREAAEREQKRKELQAVRIEEKLSELQTKLGLSNRQTSDLRTALIAQDDKREKLFTTMREEQGDPRGMRDAFRVIRDETMAELETFLTPEQLEGYKQSEERDWGRGGGERGGPPAFGGSEGARPQRDAR